MTQLKSIWDFRCPCCGTESCQIVQPAEGFEIGRFCQNKDCEFSESSNLTDMMEDRCTFGYFIPFEQYLEQLQGVA
jgi:hypothetical protein